LQTEYIQHQHSNVFVKVEGLLLI